MQKKALIIGYGSTLRGDDALGPYVVGMLEGEVGPGVCCMALPQLDLSLVYELKGVELAIFVDAVAAGQEEAVSVERVAADLKQESEGQTASAVSFNYTSHLGSVADLLAVTERLYGRAPACYLVKVRGYDFSLREGLSAAAQAAAAAAAKRVLELLASPEPSA